MVCYSFIQFLEQFPVCRYVPAFEKVCISTYIYLSNWSFGIFIQGEVFAFGSGFFGQLGLGNMQKHSLPVKVTTLTEKIVAIGTKFFHNVRSFSHTTVLSCYKYANVNRNKKKIFIYSRLSLSRIPRDSLKHFEISVPRHIRAERVRKTIN